MSEIYNISQLNTGSNFAEWILIINGWTGGLMLAVISIGIGLLLFGIMIRSEVEFDSAIMASGFAMFLITGFIWLISFQGVGAIPTAIPVIFGLFAALATFFKVVRGWMDN